MLEALCARTLFFRFVNIGFSLTFFNTELEQTLTLLQNKIQRLSPRGKTQHMIHSSLATQFRSTCVETCGRKRSRCQWLYMTLASFLSKKRHSDRKDLVPGPRDYSRWFRQNPRLVASVGRASGRNENHHDERSDCMARPG